MAKTAFEQKLVLNAWFLDQLGARDFEDLKADFADLAQVEDSSPFLVALTSKRKERLRLDPQKLVEYDSHIANHWERITKKRQSGGEKPRLLYFQWLSLLASELYLDLWFSDPEGLLGQLNRFLETWPHPKGITKPQPFAAQELNKLAFWIATGGGKTLLMHVHLLQFNHYKKAHPHRIKLGGVYLLTPSEGLSRQHLRELALSGIQGVYFDPAFASGSLLRQEALVFVIHVNQLQDTGKKSGPKTINFDLLEEDNLLFVDEGHKGSKGEVWLKFREHLCKRGFSFEYSATFGQAYKDGKGELADQYAKTILFDYSYRFFHSDGYGKDFRILNLQEELAEETRNLYLTGALLAYYQQLRLFGQRPQDWAEYLIEKPLWVFIGGTVTGQRANQEISDVVAILAFLAQFIGDRPKTEKRLHQFLFRQDRQHLVDRISKQPLFDGTLEPLITEFGSASELWEALAKDLFGGKGLLHLVELKGGSGELALKVGAGERYFGLINVGKPSELVNLCKSESIPYLEYEEAHFTDSLFQQLDKVDSPINLLIGAKKFSEGWNSFRVSTMGLMKIGQGEGPEIIQLFGRGVRLKGLGHSLKRGQDRSDETRPKHLEYLERLNVFGLDSKYMAAFRDRLIDEGVDPEPLELLIETKPNFASVKALGLKIPEVRITGREFQKTCFCEVAYDPAVKVVVNWYPKVQAQSSIEGETGAEVKLHTDQLKEAHLKLLDFDRLWFRLVAEKRRSNLKIPRTVPQELLRQPDWYTLYIPPALLALDSMEKLVLWQEIAFALLKGYLEKFYALQLKKEESQQGQYPVTLFDQESRPSYKVTLLGKDEATIAKLSGLKEELKKENCQTLANRHGVWCYDQIGAHFFDRHAYFPLLSLAENLKKGKESTRLTISPVPLNDGEAWFVEELKAYLAKKPAPLAGKETYLFRNPTGREGFAFLLEHNFYPDFLLWVRHADGKQHLIFTDPKGLRQVDQTSEKLTLHETIKAPGFVTDPALFLDSFIFSVTPKKDIGWAKGLGEKELLQKHVLFKEDERAIEKMFELAFVPRG